METLPSGEPLPALLLLFLQHLPDLSSCHVSMRRSLPRVLTEARAVTNTAALLQVGYVAELEDGTRAPARYQHAPPRAAAGLCHPRGCTATLSQA
jgi:hypothetical protein